MEEGISEESEADDGVGKEDWEWAEVLVGKGVNVGVLGICVSLSGEGRGGDMVLLRDWWVDCMCGRKERNGSMSGLDRTTRRG